MDLPSHCNQDAKLFDIKLQSCYVLERHYVLPPCLIVKWFSLVVECVIPWSVNHENVANGFTDFRTFQLLQTNRQKYCGTESWSNSQTATCSPITIWSKRSTKN